MVTIQKAWKLFLHEGRILLRQPKAYGILAAHLFFVNMLTFFSTKFFETSNSSLLPLFLCIPAVGSLVYPLLTMSQWAKPRTLAALPWFFSFPLPTWSVVLARFALACSWAWIALLTTAPLAFTLNYLGTPDWGAVVAGFILLGFMCAMQTAWGSLASVLAPHQLAAYVLAAAGNLLMMGLGTHLLYDNIPSFLPLTWNDRLSPLGIPYHLVAGFRGVLDLRDIMYFMAWTLVCLYLSQDILHFRRKQRSPGRATVFGKLAMAAGALIVILLARDVHVRWDLTEEKLYTLSGGTKDIIRRLERPIRADFYFTRSNMPATHKNYGQRIEELLREYVSTAPGKFRLHLIDPAQDSEEEVQARVAGMHPMVGADGDNAYLGLALRQGDHTLSIPLFNIQTEAQLEYELTETIVRLVQEAKPSLGVMSELPLVGDDLGENAVLRNDWAFISALRSLYQIVPLAVQTDSIPDSVQTLILVHPIGLDERTLYAIDQFLMRGGKLLLFLDAFCRLEINFPQTANRNSFASEFTRLLDHWGLVFHTDTIVGDASRASHVQVAQTSYDYPFQMQLGPNDMNLDLSISKNLQKVYVQEAGWFEVKPDAPYQFVPLMSSSEKSGLVKTELTEYMAPQQLAEQLKPDGQRRTIAGLLRGKFKSAFQASFGNFLDFKEKAKEEGSIVLVGDVDFLSDSFTVDKVQSLGQMVYKPRSDNISFIMNSLEFINGHQDLIAIRSRKHVDRSLYHLIDLERDAEDRYQGQDSSLATRLSDIQEKLGQWEVQQNNEPGQVVSKEQLTMIQDLREEEARIRRERRLLREAIDRPVNHLKQNLYLLHIVFEPLCMLLGLLWVWHERRPPSFNRT